MAAEADRNVYLHMQASTRAQDSNGCLIIFVRRCLFVCSCRHPARDRIISGFVFQAQDRVSHHCDAMPSQHLRQFISVFYLVDRCRYALRSEEPGDQFTNCFLPNGAKPPATKLPTGGLRCVLLVPPQGYSLHTHKR